LQPALDRIAGDFDGRGLRRWTKNILVCVSEFAVRRALKMSELSKEQLLEGSSATLSADEVVNIISGLSAGEKTALVKIARVYARKTPYDYEDLINEAYSRVLDPTRRSWRRGVPVIMFLGGVIRSVAWEWKRVGVNAEVDLGDEGAVERGAVARMEVMRIVALFDDDRVAQKIVLAMMQGARGEELEQASGLSKIEYESKRKKIRRRIEKSNL
jgi:hypothetical protein